MNETVAQASKPHLLKVREVADRLKVSKPTVYRWIRDKEIPHIWITDHLVRIPADEFEAWLEERRGA